MALSTGALAQEALRPAIGKPLAQARSLLASGRYANAMAAVRQADAVPGKSAHEQTVIEEMRAAIAARSGDTTTAAHAYEQLIDSGAVSGAEALNLMQGEVSIAYTQKNYPTVVSWPSATSRPAARRRRVTSLIQGYYLQGKFARRPSCSRTRSPPKRVAAGRRARSSLSCSIAAS